MLEKSLLELKGFMIDNKLTTLSFPYMIGCGLAGGNVNIVLNIIKRVFENTNIDYNFYNIN